MSHKLLIKMSGNNYFSCDYCSNLQALDDPGVKEFAIHGYGNFTVCEFCHAKAMNLVIRTKGGICYPRLEFFTHMEQQLKKQMNHLKRRYQMLQEISPYVQSKRAKECSNEEENERLFIRIRKEE